MNDLDCAVLSYGNFHYRVLSINRGRAPAGSGKPDLLRMAALFFLPGYKEQKVRMTFEVTCRPEHTNEQAQAHLFESLRSRIGGFTPTTAASLIGLDGKPFSLEADEIDDRLHREDAPDSIPWTFGSPNDPNEGKTRLPSVYRDEMEKLGVSPNGTLLSDASDCSINADVLRHCVDLDLAPTDPAWMEAFVGRTEVPYRTVRSMRTMLSVLPVRVGIRNSSGEKIHGVCQMTGYVGALYGPGPFWLVEKNGDVLFPTYVECARAAILQLGGPDLPAGITRFRLRRQGWQYTLSSVYDTRTALGLTEQKE